jgi:toxin YoeB
MTSARNLVLSAEALDDLRYWVDTDARRAGRILRLTEEICRSPFSGTGKPEPLKYLGGSVWSRRIDQEHRLVYAIEGNVVRVLQCRYHYVRR